MARRPPGAIGQSPIAVGGNIRLRSEGMHRKTTARLVGSLFLTATAAGVLSAVLLGPLDSLHSPQSIADNAHTIAAGALMVLVMTGAIALIPPTLFPVLKGH